MSVHCTFKTLDESECKTKCVMILVHPCTVTPQLYR